MSQVCTQCRAEYDERARFCVLDGTRLVPKGQLGDPLVGKLVGGRYVLERRIGSGSHGVVYQATHNEIPRAYAIKFLRSADGKMVAKSQHERFRREATTLAGLKHPGIVQVTDYGIEPDLGPFLVMDLLLGQGLENYLYQHAPLRPLDLFDLIEQLTGALATAHEQGVVHRDLKSENVMVLSSTYTTKQLRVCILDFGIIKLLESSGGSHVPAGRSTVIGTPYTMAPEQITGEGLDRRADIYSLGVMLYEAVTGELPFAGEQAWEQIDSHLHDFPDPPSTRKKGRWIPPGLDNLLLSMLAKDPVQRPGSMLEVAQRTEAVRAEVINAWAAHNLAAKPEKRTTPKIAATHTVLLVEDEPALRRLIRQLLAREGYEVVTLERGDEVLPWLRANPAPHAVVLDIMLPGLDGMALLRLARRDFATLPIIMCSSVESENVRVEARELGAYGVLDKHNQLHVLPELLEQLKGLV